MQASSLGPEGSPLGWTSIGWELSPRMRSRTSKDGFALHITQCLVACLESLNGGTWPLLFGCQDTRITRMPRQHLKVCCAQGLSASHVEKLFHYGWLTVCVCLAYSYNGGTYLMSLCFVLWIRWICILNSESRDPVLFPLSPYWNRTLNFATNRRSE